MEPALLAQPFGKDDIRSPWWPQTAGNLTVLLVNIGHD